MPFVQRDSHGRIVSLHKQESDIAQQYLSPTSAEVLDFLNEGSDQEQSKSALAESDADIARVTEDLIHLLIAKNMILFTELPDPVQRKLLAREKLRSSLQGSIDNFLDESDSI